MCGCRNCKAQWATFTTEWRSKLWSAATSQWTLDKVSQAWSGNICTAETNPQCGSVLHAPLHLKKKNNKKNNHAPPASCCIPQLRASHLSFSSSLRLFYRCGSFCWPLALKSNQKAPLIRTQLSTIQLLSWINKSGGGGGGDGGWLGGGGVARHQITNPGTNAQWMNISEERKVPWHHFLSQVEQVFLGFSALRHILILLFFSDFKAAFIGANLGCVWILSNICVMKKSLST